MSEEGGEAEYSSKTVSTPATGQTKGRPIEQSISVGAQNSMTKTDWFALLPAVSSVRPQEFLDAGLRTLGIEAATCHVRTLHQPAGERFEAVVLFDVEKHTMSMIKSRGIGQDSKTSILADLGLLETSVTVTGRSDPTKTEAIAHTVSSCVRLLTLCFCPRCHLWVCICKADTTEMIEDVSTQKQCSGGGMLVPDTSRGEENRGL